MRIHHKERLCTEAAGPFASYTEFERYLDGLGLFRMTPGLERIQMMLARLGLTRPPFFTVQVLGTNGKGSTSTMLAELARRHGLKTGLSTSPHFLSVRERVRVDGRMLDEEDWTRLANALMSQGGGELSYFEFVTALAVLAFAKHGVAFAVMETGLGGAYDATTAVEADLVVYTPIGLDHQAVLGPTIRHIAADKAEAIREGRPVVSALQTPEAENILRRIALERGAPLLFVDEGTAAAAEGNGGVCQTRPLLLAGGHQLDNARLALAAWRAGRAMLPPAARETMERAIREQGAGNLEEEALHEAWLPGRMQHVPPMTVDGGFPCSLGWPPLLLDGAHNAHSLAALGLALAGKGIAPGAVIFSCLADKNLDDMLPLVRALATGPVFVPPVKDNPRAADPADIARRIGLNAVPADSLGQALQAASAHMAQRMPEVFAGEGACHNPLLVCGSLYLLGEFFSLRPDCLTFAGVARAG